MTKINDIYYCPICKNVVEVTHEGADALVCCGESMKLLVANSVDASAEKHVPVIVTTHGGVIVHVGSAEHPMTPEHYIVFIELFTGDQVWRANLQPGMKPEAFFPIEEGKIIYVREYCNLHGLWRTES